MMPGHRIGTNIVVGGYQVNFGRYTPGDCFHPNGLSFVHADLADQFDIRLLNAPLSELSLFDADILFIANPDYPLYEKASPYRLTPEDVDALMKFLERGGGVLLLVNSFLSRPDYWEENFDHERVSLLFDRLGIRWDANFMSEINSLELARSGKYRIGYGQGGRVVGTKLPRGFKPLLKNGKRIYGFEGKIGKGKLAVLGDAGLASNGLVCFPGYDNAAFVKETFQKLAPRWCNGNTSSWDYHQFAHISAAPSKRGLNEDILRSLRPNARWTVDHHYRHLTWQRAADEGVGKRVWKRSPLDVESLVNTTKASARFHWLRLDDDAQGPEFDLDLKVNATRGNDSTDLHVIGRTESRAISWDDLCKKPQRMRPAGQVENVHVVFEMKAVFDAAGRARSARWSQGQITYARNPTAGKYEYEILLNSASGVIAPRA